MNPGKDTPKQEHEPRNDANIIREEAPFPALGLPADSGNINMDKELSLCTLSYINVDDASMQTCDVL